MRSRALLLGSILAVGALFAPACPPGRYQAVGWAVDHGVNARAELSRLLLVAVLPGFCVVAARAMNRERLDAVSELAQDSPDSRPATGHWLLRGVLPCLALAALSLLLFSRIPPSLDLFEGGHALQPLQTYIHGGLPYRDAIPAHGLGSDGGLSWLARRAVGDSVAAIVRFEALLLYLLFWPSVYLLGLAATRSVGWALSTALLLYLYLPQAGFLRPVPSLLALAAGLWALQGLSRAPWITAGFLVGIATLQSLEFGVYAALAIVACLIASRGSRRRNLAACGLGLSAVMVTAGILAVFSGTLGAVLEVHARLLPKLFPIYAFGLRSVVSNAISGDPPAILFLLCLLAAATILGGAVARWPRLGSPSSRLVPLATYFVAASLSVVYRHHFEYAHLVVPAGVAALISTRLLPTAKSRLAWGAGLLGAVALTIEPLAVLRGTRARLEPIVVPPGWVELGGPRRVEGVLVRDEDARLIDATRAFLEPGRLKPGETWLDLANAPGLYYLFDRRPPVRFYVVPLMQPEIAQEEVVAALRADESVAAVLVRSSRAADRIDGIDNRRRVPAVWAAVESCFEPAFEDRGVEFWKRKPGGCAPPAP